MQNNQKKIPVGILGATGMVGQRFISLLENHPWFEIVAVAASEKSAGKSYADAVAGRWMQQASIPEKVAHLSVYSVEHDLETIAQHTKLVFSAIDAEKEVVRSIEEAYATRGLAVVSNNSAHRWTEDIPMIMPEINPHHLALIETQRKNRGWTSGCIVVKPNCSIQSYVPLLHAWRTFGPEKVFVSTYQAISGAGKTFETWPEMVDNVIPYIGGEEEKSEKEPMKIWADMIDGKLVLPITPTISAACIRVPVSDGHMATVSVKFRDEASKEYLIDALRNFQNPLAELALPSAPKEVLTYFEEQDRPQTKLDRDLYNGMGVSVGRLRPDPVFDWKCVALSHNTIRGAAGGAILSAELLIKKGYVHGV